MMGLRGDILSLLKRTECSAHSGGDCPQEENEGEQLHLDNRSGQDS
jgi:hypothetical protein